MGDDWRSGKRPTVICITGLDVWQVADSSPYPGLCPVHRGFIAMSGNSDKVAERSRWQYTGQAGTCRIGCTVPMEQLQPLRDRNSRSGRNRVGVDGKTARPTHRKKAAMNGAQFYLFGEGQMDSRVSVWVTCRDKWSQCQLWDRKVEFEAERQG